MLREFARKAFGDSFVSQSRFDAYAHEATISCLSSFLIKAKSLSHSTHAFFHVFSHSKRTKTLVFLGRVVIWVDLSHQVSFLNAYKCRGRFSYSIVNR